jgi:hypothetical protein
MRLGGLETRMNGLTDNIWFFLWFFHVTHIYE